MVLRSEEEVEDMLFHHPTDCLNNNNNEEEEVEGNPRAGSLLLVEAVVVPITWPKEAQCQREDADDQHQMRWDEEQEGVVLRMQGQLVLGISYLGPDNRDCCIIASSANFDCDPTYLFIKLQMYMHTSTLLALF